MNGPVRRAAPIVARTRSSPHPAARSPTSARRSP